MARHGGDGPVVRYNPEFFDWLGQQIVPIEEFLYAGMDYICDLDIPLPIGIEWGDLGENLSF